MKTMRRWAFFGAMLAMLLLSGCGYNEFQRLDEQVKAAWSEVLNQYQRRADLIPNIVATVKGEAGFEQETLTKVIEARSRATSIQATPELVNNPEAFQKFQAAQGELSGALSRLELLERLRVVEGFGRDLYRCGLGAGLDHPGEGFLLEVRFPLDRGNDVGHQVRAPLVLAEHLTPGSLGLLIHALEIVVAAAREAQDGNDDQ